VEVGFEANSGTGSFFVQVSGVAFMACHKMGIVPWCCNSSTQFMKTANKFNAVAVSAIMMAGVAVTHAITIDTVTVGNASNANDNNGFGAVAYSYEIGKYEVTNTQYAAFLNVKATTDTFSLYNVNMGLRALGGITRFGNSGSYTYAVKSGYEDLPVNYVSFWDAARFANWLNNGQGSADTEIGSYTLGGVTNPINAIGVRNVGAIWVLPSENEWYKAAYYDPSKGGPGVGGYWLHATRSDALGENNPFTSENGANYYDGDYAVYDGSNAGALPVGSYVNADSFYGTFDQAGNLSEWNEQIMYGTFRGARGGSWYNFWPFVRAAFRDAEAATFENDNVGFRVARLEAILEPNSFASFQARHFTPQQLLLPTVSGEAADPDGDGLANLVEYSLGLNPNIPDPARQPALGFVNGHLTLTYVRRRDAPDLTYAVEVSSDLITWQSGPTYTEELSVTPLVGVRDQVVVRDLSALGIERRFIRLRITH